MNVRWRPSLVRVHDDVGDDLPALPTSPEAAYRTIPNLLTGLN